jgi:TonB family protein
VKNVSPSPSSTLGAVALSLALWFPTQTVPDPDMLLLAWSAAGRDDAVRRLLDENDDVDIGARDDEGWTALMHAVRGGHEETVEVLLEHGANVHSENNDGGTALHVAAEYGRTAIAEALLKAGADYEARDALGRTPFYRAFENRNAGVIDVLHAAAQADARRHAREESAPAPPQLIYSTAAPYTLTGFKEGIEGTVVLIVLVRADGSVGPANVSVGLEPSLDRSALRAVRQWRFTPALRAGKTVEAVVEVRIRFALPRELDGR